jgi:hypothetical protein
VKVAEGALDRLETKELLALIRLAEKSTTYIYIGTTTLETDVEG